MSRRFVHRDRQVSLALYLVTLVLAWPAAGGAGMITFENKDEWEKDTGTLGGYEGTLQHNSADEKLTIALTNTTPQEDGGHLTGFAFNAAEDASTSLNVDPTGGFEDLTDPNTKPFGPFDEGAAVGGNFQGGGSPLVGIAPGESETFEFDVSNPHESEMDRTDFWTTEGESIQPFVARFRGFDDGSSSKVPGVMTRNTPLPPAALMFAVTMAAWGARRWWRRGRASAPESAGAEPSL